MQAQVGPLQSLAGHKGAVLAVSFHPRFERLASCGVDGTVQLWTPGGDQPALTITHYQESWLFALSFHPKIDLLTCAAGDGQIWLWDTNTGHSTGIWGGHQAEALALAFSNDGSQLATGSVDGSVLIRESITGARQSQLPHPDTVCSLAWSPDNSYLLTGAQDGQTRVWDSASGQLLAGLYQAEGWVNSVAWSPDGHWLACGLETEQVVVLEAATGLLHKTLTGHQGSVLSVAFSADSLALATGSADGTARLWEVATGRMLAVLGDHRQAVTAVALSPQPKQRAISWLATASRDSLVRLWPFSISP